MKVKVEFNAGGVKKRLNGLARRAQFRLDQQVMKDSNYYCPQDVGSLQKSVIPSAAQAKGLLEWNEQYAKAQYYGLPNKSKDKNPNASMKWFERAKATSKEKWRKVVDAVYNG